ncbi:MAG: hypothetical protein A3B89_00710 [Candidatus Buchananbacteria bacterium RIFCSPHIGHO2_02_FULL_40_13]|uniref:Uncharacterized protein n=1 Tax=Candidatus Buchananbacteria bacterium RIFCSPLOWO2_01_FULL_39_33 TaxID=1797543 RepID=A0A1G1YH11_9BACT|nr:MAG: hypothetical protein A2820_00770 [Candidatus Buchananbacteria bacterium RIFCSPHIGHO2_01_FULL_40_35]OGY50395.1 MAG: hypothetical protein A3B89_00710 [Candidatus Buchananbacteria bacterium RIFCSPHIGHO2_02_FULL_40_13]OGY51534.1 MAG: hypothetical protein A3A02_01865 [Candidatus Buchananbacteria bacterium RIFCSPLOWO2_01_FULL_39_33]
MNVQEAATVQRAEKSLIASMAKAFPQIPFSLKHPIPKFVGVIQVQGQLPIALFIKSHQPVLYDELILD